MSTKKESGHANNVASLDELAKFVIAFGATYNPSNYRISIAGLIDHHARAEASLDHVSTVLGEWTDAVNLRQAIFRALPTLGSQIISAMKAAGLSAMVIEDAKVFHRKIKGARAVKVRKAAVLADPTTDSGTGDLTNRTISASQRSYDQLVEHFSKWVGLLEAQDTYKPNEYEFSVGGLTAHRDTLRNLNKNISTLTAILFNARYDRNGILYAPGTGAYDVASAAKNYIKAITSPSDPRYDHVRKIRFTKPR